MKSLVSYSTIAPMPVVVFSGFWPSIYSGELDAPAVAEIDRGADEHIGYDLIEVSYVHIVAFFDVRPFGIIRSGRIADTPVVGRLRVEGELVRNSVAIVAEYVVTVDSHHVESCRTARDECRDVRRRCQ